jgi:hypothetical protein
MATTLVSTHAYTGDINLASSSRPVALEFDITKGDAESHLFSITVKNNGEDVSLSGASAAFYIVRDFDGKTVVLDADITGSVMSKALSAECAAYARPITILATVTSGGITRAVWAGRTKVRDGASDVYVDPGDTVVFLKTISQTLTSVQKAQVIANIGAATAAQGALADTMSHKNLLHNWYFLSTPVNQRGASGAIASGYFYDRWMRYAGTITIAATYLSLPADASIEQRIEGNALAGKVVDVSVMVGGSVISGSGTFPASAGTASVTLTGFGTATLGYATGYMYVRFTATDSTRQLQAVKLELGTSSTLANDAPPDYGEELTRCMRFFQVLPASVRFTGTTGSTTGARIRLLLFIPMRIAPTPTGSPTSVSLYSEAASYTETSWDSLTFTGDSNSSIYWDIAKSTWGLVAYKVCVAFQNTPIYVSADL